jgi:hypothetical protein
LAAAILITGLVLWAMFVPAPLEALANPAHPPNPAKAAWYFMGLQELLLHMHPLAALILPGLVLLAMVILPYLDKSVADIGVYFRSRVGTLMALAGALLALVLVPFLVVADEYWIDLPALLPTWPTILSNGLVPLLVTLAGLVMVYVFLRIVARANHSESLVGLFTFVVVGFIVLTITGIFFRGANMALVLPV